MMQKGLCVVLGLLLVAILAGCEATAKSDRAEPGWQTTTSYDRIMAVENPPPSPMKKREWSPTVARYEPPVVTHFASYFEDPIVVYGDGNDTYGWTWFDPVAVPFSAGWFALDTVAIPISLVKQPPCVLYTTNLDQQVGGCGLANDSQTTSKKVCATATAKASEK